MTQDEIIRMAREAGLAKLIYGEVNGYTTLETNFDPSKIADFAALVAAHEREACAKVCEADIEEGEAPWTACDYAAAIRARGQK